MYPHNGTMSPSWRPEYSGMWCCDNLISHVDTRINISDLLEITNKQLELGIQILYAVR